jgi:hypothetical protein
MVSELLSIGGSVGGDQALSLQAFDTDVFAQPSLLREPVGQTFDVSQLPVKQPGHSLLFRRCTRMGPLVVLLCAPLLQSLQCQHLSTPLAACDPTVPANCGAGSGGGIQLGGQGVPGFLLHRPGTMSLRAP